jgi:hypothetical protein
MYMHVYTCTVESRDYAPPPLCMLALGKSGEGAYTRDPNISAWRPLPTVECHVGARSLAVWWAKLEKNDKVRHNMTQIASLLVVATVFTRLMVCDIYFTVRGGGAYTRDKTGTWAKNAGGAYARGGGVIAGFYGTYMYNIEQVCMYVLCGCAQVGLVCVYLRLNCVERAGVCVCVCAWVSVVYSKHSLAWCSAMMTLAVFKQQE